MPYIGKTPVIGNFVKLDAISVVNGQAAYTMNNGGSAFTAYNNVNQFLVSLNGVLQAPTDSFTVAGSTLTFASNLATGDVIDFVIVLGNTLDIGTPSDNTVTAAKLNDDIISGQTALASEPADTDEFLVSDAGTIKRIDYSLIKSSPTHVLLSTTNITSGTATVDITGMDSTYKNYLITITNLHCATNDVTLNCQYIIGGSAHTGAHYDYINHSVERGDDNVVNSSNSATSSKLMHSSLSNSNENTLSGTIKIFNPSETTYRKMIQAHISYINTGSASCHNVNTTYNNDNTSAVTGLRFLMSSGNIDIATFKLYGVN